MATDTIYLPEGHTAEIRTDLTGGDQRWFFIQRDKLINASGTGKPARQEPDPANPAVMLDIPAEPAYLDVEGQFTLLDLVAGRLLVSSTMPGVLPWRLPVNGPDGVQVAPGTRDDLDIDAVNEVDDAVGKQMERLRGVTAGPKPKTNGPTSGATSTESASALPTEPTPATSSTQPA